MLLLIKRLYPLQFLEEVIPEALQPHSLHGMAFIITVWESLMMRLGPSTVVRGDFWYLLLGCLHAVVFWIVMCRCLQLLMYLTSVHKALVMKNSLWFLGPQSMKSLSCHSSRFCGNTLLYMNEACVKWLEQYKCGTIAFHFHVWGFH